MRKTITALLLLGSIIAIAGACCGAAQKCAEPANRNSPTCAIVNDVVDCTTDNAKTLIAEFGPLVVDLVKYATGADGTVDWSKLEGDLKSAGLADGMCVIADVVKSLTSKTAAQGEPGRPNYASLGVGFDTLRAKISPGVKYKTPHGEL